MLNWHTKDRQSVLQKALCVFLSVVLVCGIGVPSEALASESNGASLAGEAPIARAISMRVI